MSVSDTLQDLIFLAITTGREEDLELTDRDDLDTESIVALREEIKAIRGVCDTLSRALANLWLERHGPSRMVMDDGTYVQVGYGSSSTYRVADGAGFAEWLAAQEPEVIERVISGVRVTAMGNAARDTFLERVTNTTPTITTTNIERLPERTRQYVAKMRTGEIFPDEEQ